MDKIYETLFNAYMDDVEKYARNESIAQIIRYKLKNGWSFAAERITFERFGSSNYKSREVSEAFRTIEKAMLLELVYPVTSVQIPMLTTMSHRPKLIWFDTGLVNYIAGVRDSLFSVTDVMDAWRGRIAEHIVAQELLSLKWQVSAHRQFWDRQKTQKGKEFKLINVPLYYVCVLEKLLEKYI